MESLAKHFRDLTRAAFARYGFAYADVLSQWPAIIGEDLARLCEPERIKWPRSSGERRGGTLILRAAPGRALDLQHESSRIVERINSFYGYAAIAAVKVVQGPLAARPAARARPVIDRNLVGRLEARLQDIADPDLKAALKKLGEGALAWRPSPEK
jgi:hypothetical protein